MNFVKVSAVAIALALGLNAGSAFAASAGEKVFKKCKACHTANKGGKHKSGPNLFGVVGRNPKKFIGKKTSMGLKLKKESDRKAVIAYLKSMK